MKKKDQFVLVFGTKIPRWRDCPKCGKKLSCEMGTYSYANMCLTCLGKKLREQRKLNRAEHVDGVVGAMKGFKDVTAIGIDRATGKQVGVTEKGEHVPLDKTRYDLRNDPHGWRATGKKVRSTDSRGRPNI